MQKLNSRLMWGAVLIVAGIVFLLESLGFIFIGSVWPVFFGIAGLLFLLTFIRDSRQWWAAIPGFTLLGIALVIFMNTVTPALGRLFSGSVFLGCLGLSFIAVLLSTRGEQWWAVIPGGVILTLSAVTALSPFAKGELTTALFMLGFALTFAIIYVVPFSGKRMLWAIYPAVIMAIIGILILSAATHLAQFIWPAVIIGTGLYLILKNIRMR
jgi:hypothetical protein